jgi:hypothetical protein
VEFAGLINQVSNAVHSRATEVAEVMREGEIMDMCGPDKGNYPVCGQHYRKASSTPSE